LDSPVYRRRLFHFNPNIDAGTIVQIGVVVIAMVMAYGTYTSDKAAASARMAAAEKDIGDNKITVKESIGDLKSEVKEVQKSLVEVNQSLAVLKARPQNPAK
jgi:hypothetical protein